MEEEVQRKLHFNSSLLKQEFSGRWKKIVEMLTPYEIIKDADLRKVTSLPDDREKVHLLLKILSRYKQCQRFVEILEQNGYSDVCQKIKETGRLRSSQIVLWEPVMSFLSTVTCQYARLYEIFTSMTYLKLFLSPSCVWLID